MITIKFFEDIVLYSIPLIEGNIINTDILFTNVILNDTIYKYFQMKNTIIISNESEKLIDILTNKISVISIKNHLKLIELSKERLDYYIKIDGITHRSNNVEFVDITRELKLVDITRQLRLKKLIKNNIEKDSNTTK